MILKRVGGQSLAEYALLVTAIIAVAASMFPLLKRGIQRVVKISTDQIANQEGSEQNYFSERGFTVGVNSASLSDRLRTRRDWPGVVQTQDFDTIRAHDQTLTNLGFVRELSGKKAVAPTTWCGDGVCTATEESCLSCWVDCGACPSAGNGICEIGENCKSHPTDCICTTDGGCQTDASGKGFCCTKNANQCGEDGCGGTHPVCAGANMVCASGSCGCQFFACNGECCVSGQVCRTGGDGKCCTQNCPAGVGACGAPDGCGGVCQEDDGCADDEVCFGMACCKPDGTYQEGVDCGGVVDNCGLIYTECNDDCDPAVSICPPVKVCYNDKCCEPQCQSADFCNGHDDSCGGTCTNTDCNVGKCVAGGTCCVSDCPATVGCAPKTDKCGDLCLVFPCPAGKACNTVKGSAGYDTCK